MLFFLYLYLFYFILQLYRFVLLYFFSLKKPLPQAKKNRHLKTEVL